eukprot:TRINITY_DN16293_c0_g2_i1.p1 TRINITY_DN16293_c0_g2~~TRINITY_DN16293_c0_g2_i1.p1  ORF type:complete len:295 (+),score=83.68 TRINITY_DN16293_c0_g2_i1:108-887(+)
MGGGEEDVPADPFLAYRKINRGVRKSPLQYTEGNLQMMKEYGMSEEEWAMEFGGRPHQQRQSPVARSDLQRLKIHTSNWDYCSHKFIPLKLCYDSIGQRMGPVKTKCKHEVHEYELCMCSEIIRQNQILQLKRQKHATYTEADKNWLYNEPNFGHMTWRSKYGGNSLKAMFMMGHGPRLCDPPTYEASMEQNTVWNPNIIRSEPHPHWLVHKLSWNMHIGLNTYWNRHAMYYPEYDGDRAPEMCVPFDPRVDGAFPHPW